MRTLTDEQIINRSSFSSEAACLLDSIAKSSPSCFIYEGLRLDKYLPSYDSNSNLTKLARILPNAAMTIRNYLKYHFEKIESRNRNTRKKISREDVLLAFAGDEHIKVINQKVANFNYSADLPWEILGHKFSVAEYVFMHTLSLCELIATSPYHIAGKHASGIVINGLHFRLAEQFLSKTVKNGYGIVHFATVVSVTNDQALIKKIQDLQVNGIYAEAVDSLKGKKIDFS